MSSTISRPCPPERRSEPRDMVCGSRGPRSDAGRLGRRLGGLLLLFWAMYFSLIAVTNLVNLLDALGTIHWTFLDSGNFGYLRSVVRVYHVGPSPTKVLLGGAVAIEAVAAGLFWSALRHPGGARTWQALCHAVGVWVAFILATELFVAYPSEAPFRELLLLTIATAIYFAGLVDRVPMALGRGETMQGVGVSPSLELTVGIRSFVAASAGAHSSEVGIAEGLGRAVPESLARALHEAARALSPASYRRDLVVGAAVGPTVCRACFATPLGDAVDPAGWPQGQRGHAAAIDL